MLDNAAYRIDIPKEWNHRLVVFYHGYSEAPVIYKTSLPTSVDEEFLSHGYAVVQSGYSVTGWALGKAFPETEALREYFVSKYGKPSQTYVTGESMGGTLTMMTIEQSPERYDGALALCGRLDSSNEARQKAFALLAASDYYFPGILPSLDPVPHNFQVSKSLRQRVLQALDRNPKGATAMRALMELRSNKDVAGMMLFTVYVVKDAQEKADGNPFDNRNYIYTGSPDDRALNDGVRRYKADAIATQFFVRYYTPTGRLLKPMLALQTTYDPVTNPSSIYPYELAVEGEGRTDNFVQQYVHADGHCHFTPQQIDAAFSELVSWVDQGKRPAPGLLPEDHK
ncbi:MAG: DUF6351 family protein [Acidobacteriaceae bacterium]